MMSSLGLSSVLLKINPTKLSSASIRILLSSLCISLAWWLSRTLSLKRSPIRKFTKVLTSTRWSEAQNKKTSWCPMSTVTTQSQLSSRGPLLCDRLQWVLKARSLVQSFKTVVRSARRWKSCDRSLWEMSRSETSTFTLNWSCKIQDSIIACGTVIGGDCSINFSYFAANCQVPDGSKIDNELKIPSLWYLSGVKLLYFLKF